MIRSHLTFLASAVMAGALFANGCSKPEPAPVAYMGTTLASADLGLDSDVSSAPTEFVILDNGRSTGRFPAALAVARLKPPGAFFVPMTEEPDKTNWRIETMPPENAVWWNKLFNSVPEIRTVEVLDDRSVVVPDADLGGIIDAARMARTDLCLIYGPSPAEGEDRAALAGVLVDVETGENIACLHATAGPEDFEPPRLSRFKEDLRHIDPNYLAARKLEQLLFRGMLQLIHHDQPPAATQPSQWKDHAIREKQQQFLIMPNQPAG